MNYEDVREVTKDQFLAAITSDKGDRFAKTFVSKANTQNLWDKAYGIFTDDGELMGCIITTHSKREPVVTNLQLLHTFVKHRGKGVGRVLVDWALFGSRVEGAKYFRVSSEKDAIDFYKKCGFQFAGRQKSGCQLSIFRWEGAGIRVHDYTDPTIRAAVFRKGKGGCVEIFFEDPVPTLETL